MRAPMKKLASCFVIRGNERTSLAGLFAGVTYYFLMVIME